MDNLVNQIVAIILGFIRDFLSKMRLQRLADALGAQKEKANEAVKESDNEYEDYKKIYDKWVTSGRPNNIDAPASPDVQPSPGVVQQSSGQAAKDNRRTRKRKRSAVPVHRRTRSKNKRARKRK